MSEKMNLFTNINIYSDLVASNNPTKNNVKWGFDEKGLDISEPESKSLILQAGESIQLFSGLRSISDDGTTKYDLSLKTGTSNTYSLSYNSGTAPDFKVSRSIGTDSTTEVTVTKNGPILKFTSTGGTLFDLVSAGVQAGDIVRITDEFNTLNQGKFKILSFDTTSFQVENISGLAEGPITLGANFATVLQIFSAAGVQVGDKVSLTSAFSSLTLGTYEITDVNPEYIEIYSINSLPEETGVLTQLKIYNNSKQFIYIEADKKVSIEIDTVTVGYIEQLRSGIKLKNGLFIKSGEMYSGSLTNVSDESAQIFYVIAE